MGRSTEARLATAERRARVIELRRQNVPFIEIGKELGVSGPRAHEIYSDALRDIPARGVELYRAEQIELCYAAIEALLAIADRCKEKQPRTSVEALNASRGWTERLARLTQTDAPIKVDATVTETTQEDLELIDMVNAAKARAAAAEAELTAQADE